MEIRREYWGSYWEFLFAAIAVLWFMNKKELIEQLSLHSPFRFPNWSITLMKFSLPLIIGVSLTFNLLDLFNLPSLLAK